MAPEPSNLRHLFGEAPPTGIDVSSVIRRSRARRTPRLLGAGTLAVLALGTIAYGGFAGLSSLGGSSASDAGAAPAAESSEQGMGLMADGAARSTAEQLNLCGGPVAEIPPSETGLVLSVAFPAEAEVGATSIDGVVTMTNTGPEAVAGYTGPAPAVVLSRDGTVVWHSNGPVVQLARETALDPGESLEFAASFTPVVCSAEDDANGFRDDLPPAPAGEYQVSALIDLTTETAESLVSGPAAQVILRSPPAR